MPIVRANRLFQLILSLFGIFSVLTKRDILKTDRHMTPTFRLRRIEALCKLPELVKIFRHLDEKALLNVLLWIAA